MEATSYLSDTGKMHHSWGMARNSLCGVGSIVHFGWLESLEVAESRFRLLRGLASVEAVKWRARRDSNAGPSA